MTADSRSPARTDRRPRRGRRFWCAAVLVALALGALSSTAGSATVRPTVTASCPTAAQRPETDRLLKTAAVRAAYGADGSGITIGVISDSYDRLGGAAADVTAGALPGPGNPCGRTAAVVQLHAPRGAYSTALATSTDEGRAMAQIVHAAAPGARIVFASGGYGVHAFAQSIRDLAAAGADVIVDDLVYDDEPVFQTGPIDAAIDEVSYRGVVYVTAANNTTVRSAGGADLSSWETPAFRPASCPAAVAGSGRVCEDLTGGGVGSAPIALAAGSDLSLQWAQPYRAVTTRFRLYLLDGAGKAVASSAPGANLGTADAPRWPITTLTTRSAMQGSIVVARTSGTSRPRLKLELVQNFARSGPGWLDSPAPGDVVGPSVLGHNGSPHAVSVGAVPQDAPAAPEAFSAQGPVTHYFGTWSAGAAAPRLATPRVLGKPDVVGVDGVRNTMFDNGHDPSVPRFYGTSAAAPGVAAVAALLRQYASGLTSAQIRLLLRASATPVSGGSATVGSGLVDASAAFAALPGRPTLAGSQAGRRAVVLHFRTPASRGVGLRGYSARCTSANGGATRTGHRYRSPLTVGGLTAGRTYRCVVRATAKYGPGPWSVRSGARVPFAA